MDILQAVASSLGILQTAEQVSPCLPTAKWHLGGFVLAAWHDMWDLVPRLGIEPGPLALGARNPSRWTTRELPPSHSDAYISEFTIFQIGIIW